VIFISPSEYNIISISQSQHFSTKEDECHIVSMQQKEAGREQVHYWRTQDKKEIDFIVNLPDSLLPVETKLHFPRAIPTVLDTFITAYPSGPNSVPAYRLVGLEGDAEESGMIFPWQL
jgi:hypothetical protein